MQLQAEESKKWGGGSEAGCVYGKLGASYPCPCLLFWSVSGCLIVAASGHFCQRQIVQQGGSGGRGRGVGGSRSSDR